MGVFVTPTFAFALIISHIRFFGVGGIHGLCHGFSWLWRGARKFELHFYQYINYCGVYRQLEAAILSSCDLHYGDL
jgi:hypothetical protein